MRSKSRFTTLVLLETRESYSEIRARSLCTLRCHRRQEPTTFATKGALLLSGTGLPLAESHQLPWRAHSITSRASCLVLVRLAHDRRFVGAILFLLVFVLFLFIRISGRDRVAHDCEGAPVDPAGKLLRDV